MASLILLRSLCALGGASCRPVGALPGHGEYGAGGGRADDGVGTGGAFRAVLQSRYWVLITLLVLRLTWVNSTGGYVLGKVVSENFVAAVGAGRSSDEGEFVARFYSELFSLVNVAALFFNSSSFRGYWRISGSAARVIQLTGVPGEYVILAFFPLFGVVCGANTVENSTGYSLQNTVRNVLFLSITREHENKAVQLIDTFFLRSGYVLSALVVFGGMAWFSPGTRDFALFNVALVAV